MDIKKIFKFGAVALAATAILAACGSGSSNSSDSDDNKKEEVVLATVGTTRPFSYEVDGELTGYDIEVAKAVFEGSDKYDVKYQKTEWSSIFTGLDSGKFQIGANNISYSEEREEKYLFSLPIATNPLVLAVNKDSGIKSYDDIAGKSTQVVQGTATAKMLEDYNTNNSDKETEINYTSENITQMLMSVNEGKFDYKIFETQSIKTIIEEQGLDNLEIIELDLDSEEQPYVYFLFADGQEDLQEYVNGRLKELYEDGTLEEISEEFLGGDYLPEKEDIEK